MYLHAKNYQNILLFKNYSDFHQLITNERTVWLKYYFIKGRAIYDSSKI